MNPPKLNPPLTIAQVAAMAGWSRKRTLAYLQRLNTELQGLLLIPSGGATNRRYLIHLSALQRAVPEMFEPVRSVDADLDEHAERLDTLERRVLEAATTVGAVNREIADLRQRVRAA